MTSTFITFRDGKDCKRTTNSVFRLRCCERPEMSSSTATGVKLIIFDFDETLTLVTLMTPDGKLLPEQEEWATKVNFESPWCQGSRVAKLDQMFKELVVGRNPEERRSLAILTRNGNASGVSAVVNLLKAARLDHHFAAIWTLPRKRGRWNGASFSEGKWQLFDPPPASVSEHKADVLQQIAQNPAAWFPQMSSPSTAEACSHLQTLLPEEIVLVDDQRTNFQSTSGTTVMRYVKVARYDQEYREFGFMRDMGGIGANDEADYDALKRFVEDPWMCKDTYQVRCQEREFKGQEKRLPVSLVVFDFDETLTLATFMPDDKDFLARIGCLPSDWNKSELVEYNFESPYSDGSRVKKLSHLLKVLAQPKGEPKRTLAVLTKNEHGVVAVLNLLQFAGLANFFSAIWTLNPPNNLPGGAYQEEDGTWQLFETPGDINQHKADVLHNVAQRPDAWFPQLQHGGGAGFEGLKDLVLENIVMVDDERSNFRSDGTQAKVLRYCKVARYDENYRDCGLLNQMGGLGAHGDEDFNMLQHFVAQPWEYPYESQKRRGTLQSLDSGRQRTQTDHGEAEENMLRRDSEPAEDEPEKAPRVRTRRVSTMAEGATIGGATADRRTKTEPVKLEDFLAES